MRNKASTAHQTEIVDGETAVVQMLVPIDSATGPGVEEYINELLDKGVKYVLLDGERMRYVSSEGIGLFLYLEKRISEAGGLFVFFNLIGEIRTLFDLLGFNTRFLIAGSRQDAFSVLERENDHRKSGAIRSVRDHSDFAENLEMPTIIESEPGLTSPASQAPTGRVVACTNCNNPVRVFKQGTYLCPHCNNKFTVMNEEAATEAPGKSAYSNEGFMPLVIECANCGSLIRIKRSGNFRCPDCSAGFNVASDQTVIF